MRKKSTKLLSLIIAIFMVMALVPFSALSVSAETETELEYYGIYINVPAIVGGEKVSVADISIMQYDKATGNQINDAYKYVEAYAVDSSGEALWKRGDRFGENMNDSEVYQADIDYYVTFGIRIKAEYADNYKFAQELVDSRKIYIQSGDNIADLSFEGDYDHIEITAKIVPEIAKVHLDVSQLRANGTMTVGDIEITDKLNGEYYTVTNNDNWLKDREPADSTNGYLSLTEKLVSDSYYGTRIIIQETKGYIGDNTEVVIDCPSYYVIKSITEGLLSGKHTTYVDVCFFPQVVISEKVDFDFDASAGKKLSEVDFNIPSDANYYLALFDWFNADGVQIIDTNVAIEENEEYSVVLILYPKEGYRFKEDIAVTWSGMQEMTVNVQLQNHDFINVKFQFTAKPPHVHEYGTEWKSDGTNHWNECSCGDKANVATHSGGTATCTAKAKCETCNAEYGETLAHTHGTEWKNDATNHWNECECGDKANVAPHADSNNDGKCDVCSYAMPKVEENDPSAPTPDLPDTNTDKPTDATESKKDDETEAPANNGCGGCGSSAALSAIAIVAVVGSALVIKKKKD